MDDWCVGCKPGCHERSDARRGVGSGDDQIRGKLCICEELHVHTASHDLFKCIDSA